MLDALLRGLVAGAVDPATDAPPEVKRWLDDLLSKADTYRDGALIVLAYAVDAGTAASVATPPAGRRGVAQKLAIILDELHVPATRDAFQTLAKGTSTLLGRHRHSWNQLLGWAAHQETIEPIEQAMGYLAAGIAATARDLPTLPELDVARFSFARLVGVVEDLLGVPSGGAHEQFVFAALLHAEAEERGGRRVETKVLSATDASAGTAADVQLLEGGLVVEAYEVTANPWRTKVVQAAAVLRHYDLLRIHIVAPGPAPSGQHIEDALTAAALPAGLVAGSVDLSVLDVGQECRSLVHRLTRPGRRTALAKLWEHLVVRQPNDQLVAQLVARVEAADLSIQDGLFGERGKERSPDGLA